MFELLLMQDKIIVEEDDHELPFPSGTPFKGVVRSGNFINGLDLANRIGLTAGTPFNNNAGWLHFVEDNGYNIYIAKKPLRYGVSWGQINAAQNGKEIEINGKTFIVDFLTGLKVNNMSAALVNGGGQWNRYMYNIYGGEYASSLPETRENWGSYTERMLGIPFKTEGIAVNGSFNYLKENVTNDASSHVTRGMNYPNVADVPNVQGVWYGAPSNNESNYGWRPMLYEKGTVMPLPDTPFKGEIPQTSFITLPELQDATGFKLGAPLNPNTPWMMIVEDGKTYYWPKAPFVSSVLREKLNEANVVTGDMVITVRGKQYKVRLMTGRDSAISSTAGGEWLRWMSNLINGEWAAYTTTELGGPYPQDGGLCHVWDKHGNGDWALCGYPGMLGAWYQPTGGANNVGYGWRPVLELVE